MRPRSGARHGSSDESPDRPRQRSSPDQACRRRDPRTPAFSRHPERRRRAGHARSPAGRGPPGGRADRLGPPRHRGARDVPPGARLPSPSRHLDHRADPAGSPRVGERGLEGRRGRLRLHAGPGQAPQRPRDQGAVRDGAADARGRGCAAAAEGPRPFAAAPPRAAAPAVPAWSAGSSPTLDAVCRPDDEVQEDGFAGLPQTSRPRWTPRTSQRARRPSSRRGRPRSPRVASTSTTATTRRPATRRSRRCSPGSRRRPSPAEP